jgi:hypothetical protein
MRQSLDIVMRLWLSASIYSCRHGPSSTAKDRKQRAIMPCVRAPRSDNNPSNFYFVPVDGLQNRERKNAKPQSQRYLAEARRHVM